VGLAGAGRTRGGHRVCAQTKGLTQQSPQTNPVRPRREPENESHAVRRRERQSSKIFKLFSPPAHVEYSDIARNIVAKSHSRRSSIPHDERRLWWYCLPPGSRLTAALDRAFLCVLTRQPDSKHRTGGVFTGIAPVGRCNGTAVALYQPYTDPQAQAVAIVLVVKKGLNNRSRMVSLRPAPVSQTPHSTPVRPCVSALSAVRSVSVPPSGMA
jgi:hypothetical protein